MNTEALLKVASMSRDFKSSICDGEPMADMICPFLHIISTDERDTVLGLVIPTDRPLLDLVPAVQSVASGPIDAVAVVTDCFMRDDHESNLVVEIKDPRLVGTGSLADEHRDDPFSSVVMTMCVHVVHASGEREALLMPYRWDDDGCPEWGHPIMSDRAASGALVLLAAAVVGVA